MTERILEALDAVRPFLHRDGGDVELISVVDGVVKVRLLGHCAGCPMSQMTLKQGIEAHLKKCVPEVREVITEQRLDGHFDEPRHVDSPCAMPPQEAAPRYTSALREEHDEIRRHLQRLETALQKLSTWPMGNWRDGLVDAGTVRKFLSTKFSAHMDTEEQTLYARLKPLITWGQPTVALQAEHDQLRKQIFEFSNAIFLAEFGSPAKLLGVGGNLVNAIRNHLFREENVLFFEADELLAKETTKCSTHIMSS